MLISSLFSGGSQQSQPKGAEKQKDKSETGNTEKNNAKAKDEQPAAQETQPTAETAPAQSSQAAAPAQKAQAPAAEAPAPVAPTPVATSDAEDSGMSEAQARAAAEARIEAAQARSLIDSIAPVSSSPQQASKSYLSALLKSNAPTEAASTAKSAAEPVADKADKALKAAA
ncbi:MULTISPECIES: hypothetical protein [Sulfitobacter]|jgi:hypothetical protein|uniref:hypothetical protein n=1 Tax=Sulfitobacter TaxID=60136 RepID=UPI00044C1E66|nr:MULTISPECIES: hypothetical protein [Sulfitobacter]HBM38278.1 hypothetical protein [Sulfitobacter sp.]KAJ31766.1 hypothetical protein PM01_01105 [Sulfitobacter pontiacus 3SOLIMAR09]PTA98692.1 hypothetical protein C8254_09425 [Sulfitobacter sp. CB-A]ULO19190.1 hypothetical protein IV89_002196 [Sulfitobacter sp. CB2047]GLO77987.1 hypothetical protein MACH23_14080 [Sulfitobacter pontiacus]|tara:strand:- start:205 stop:717 length:513 start_codon:yes stop_codon:yes gene_type:complete